MTSRDDVYRKYTDFVPDEEMLLLFGFEAAVLENAYGTEYMAPIARAVLHVFAELVDHPSARVRTTAFTVYSGDTGNAYVIGIPRLTPVAVSGSLEAKLRGVEGFRRASPGGCTGLSPVYRYDRGRLIAYVGERTAGNIRNLGELTGVESDLPVHLRQALAASELGRECYGGLDYRFLDAPSLEPANAISLFDNAIDAEPDALPHRRPASRAGTRRRASKLRSGPSISIQLPLDFGESIGEST